MGKYLQGQDNNAYINGITSQDGKLYASWTVRETPDASTNHDFYFAFSEDDGKTWKASSGTTVAKPITPSTAGIKVYTIPQSSEIINQEAQCADSKGRFHALMRDKSSGTARFYHYMRTAAGIFLFLRAISFIFILCTNCIDPMLSTNSPILTIPRRLLQNRNHSPRALHASLPLLPGQTRLRR